MSIQEQHNIVMTQINKLERMACELCIVVW